MPHPVIFQHNFKSIVKEETGDVYYLVTQADGKKHYQVLPKHFIIRCDPDRSLQFLTAENNIIL